ncbi:hypothetical protein GCM10027051_28870 [Niabella terrae]
MTTAKLPVAIISSFLWIGFVGAISFMEAWVKFRAPGVTTALGLGIGRLVFGALNKVEWVLVFIILLSLLLSRQPLLRIGHLAYFVPLVIIAIQTIWLLPALDLRAQLHIEGAVLPPSSLHFWYVGLEIIKIVSLFWFGCSLFKTAAPLVATG